MSTATVSPILLLYASCALAACFVLLEHRSLRRLISDTRRLQAVFADTRPPFGRHASRRHPLALPLGSAIPDFRADQIDSIGGIVDRRTLIGESAMIILFRASQF